MSPKARINNGSGTQQPLDVRQAAFSDEKREHFKCLLPSLETPWMVSMFSNRGNEASSCGLSLENCGTHPAAQGAKEALGWKPEELA